MNTLETTVENLRQHRNQIASTDPLPSKENPGCRFFGTFVELYGTVDPRNPLCWGPGEITYDVRQGCLAGEKACYVREGEISSCTECPLYVQALHVMQPPC